MGLRVDRLRELREKHGLSQRQVAQHCGLSQTQVYNYENGLSDPTAEKLVALAELFNVSLDYLTGRTDELYVLSQSKELDKEEQAMVNTYRREGWTGVIRLGAEKLSK